MVNEKVKVVLIAGSGRSGSTLLDRVLGHFLHACSTGELRHIWERGCLENQLCGCGQKFSDCSFWQPILADLKKKTQIENIDEVVKLKQSVDRMKEIPNLLFPAMRNRQKKWAYKTYSQVLLHLFEAISRESGCDLVVDSSKDPSYVYLLNAMARDELIDLYIIHMVRDSRAVAYSWLRNKKRPEIHWKEEEMPIYSVFKSAWEWIMFNFIISLVKFSTGARYFFLRYEDFTSILGQELQKIILFLGLEPAHIPSFQTHSVELSSAHTISGNPMRFERGTIRIKPDTEWVEKLSPSNKTLVTCLTFPLLIQYRYHL